MSKGPKHNLPTVSSDIPRDLRLFIDRVAEALSGNGEDRFVTAKELANAGVYDETDTSTDAGGEDPDVIIPVLTPPKPTLTATAGYEYVVLEWPTPSYYGHSSTTVYRNLHSADAPTPTFDDSNTVAVTSVSGFTSVFSDYLGTGQTATYFIQFVNINNVEGPVSDPVTRTTAINVEEVIDVLGGKLTSTEFVNDLSTFEKDGGAPYLVNALNNYVVKLGVGGTAAGFGISNTGSDAEPEFDFAVLADNFFITAPVDFNQASRPTAGVSKGDVWRDSNANPIKYYVALRNNPTSLAHWKQIEPAPFIVRTTDDTDTNADGETINIPAGVYIRDGFIQNGTITNAKIGEAAIDAAKIQDATITTAKVGALDAGRIVTGTLKSPNFTNTAGQAGFFLGMGVTNGTVPTPVLDDDGNLKFNDDGTIEVTYPAGTVRQESIRFILRGALDNYPALQLIDNVVTISALAIRDVLKSVSFDNTPNSRGFKIDLGTSGEDEDEGGFVQFRDNTGEDVFLIDDSGGKGVVKMTAAAIRDAITSYNFDITQPVTTPGFHLGIGQKFDGTVENTKFYLYGKNGKLLFGVDENGDQLSDRIANSVFISNQLANAQNINPFMTEPDFSKDDVIRPRGWYLYASPNDGDLTYNTANELTGYPANTVLKLKSENNTHSFIGALSAAIRRDPKVSEYSVVITWRLEDVTINEPDYQGLDGGLYFRAFTTSDEDFPAGQNVVTPASAYNYVFINNEPTIVGRMTNGRAANLFVVEDTYEDSGKSEDEHYQDVTVTSVNEPKASDDIYFHTTKLKIKFTGSHADTTYFSLDIINATGLGTRAALYIDKVVVTPIALAVDATDVSYQGTSLSESKYAWFDGLITSGNITTFFEEAAITEAVIRDAAVGTLKIQEDAVIVPAGDSSRDIKLNVSNYFLDLSPYTTVGFWGEDEVPSALIVGGQVGYVGGDMGGNVAGAATVYARLKIEFYSNKGEWVYNNNATIQTAAVQSMQEGYGGQAVTTAKVDVPTWSRGARLLIQGRNERYSGWYLRMATRYSFFAMAAKR